MWITSSLPVVEVVAEVLTLVVVAVLAVCVQAQVLALLPGLNTRLRWALVETALQVAQVAQVLAVQILYLALLRLLEAVEVVVLALE